MAPRDEMKIQTRVGTIELNVASLFGADEHIAQLCTAIENIRVLFVA